MTYATYLERDDVRFIYYVLIGGLPYVFSHVDKPTDWALTAGYTWSKTFLHFRNAGSGSFQSSLQAISQKLDWERGTTVSGSLTLEFLYDPEDTDSTWLELITPKTKNRIRYQLDPENLVQPSDTSMTFIGTPPAENDIVYFGLETIEMGAASVVSRGKFESWPQWYGRRGARAGLFTGGPVEGTNWPNSWRGRPISLWRAACTVDQAGNRVPLSTTIQGDHDQEVFRGIIYELDWDVSQPGSVRFETQSLDQLLERPVMGRSQVYRPGPSAVGKGWCYVESGGPNRVEVSVPPANFVGMLSPTVFPENVAFDLTAASSFFTGGALGEVSTIMNAIIGQLNTSYSADTQNAIVFSWELVSEDGEPTVRIGAGRRLQTLGITSPIQADITFHVATAIDKDAAVLRAMGAQDDIIIAPGAALDTITSTAVDQLDAISWSTLSDPLPHYYLGRRGQTRLYWHSGGVELSADTDDPPAFQGSVQVDATVDAPGVRFGEHEVLRATFRAPIVGTLFSDSFWNNQYYALINDETRGRMFRRAQAILVPADEVEDEKHAIRVGLLFDNNYIMDILRQLMVSNGDQNTGGVWSGDADAYNVLKDGFGAGIPSSYVDNAAFERIKQSRQSRTNGWWLEGSEPLRDILGKVGLALSLNFLTTLGTGSAGDLKGRQLISVRELAPATDGASTVATIDASWTDTLGSPVSHSRNERSIINRVQVEFDFDPIEDKFLSKDNTLFDGNSAQQYGLSRPLKLQIPWVHGLGSLTPELINATARIFQNRGRPHAIYKVPFVKPEGWAIEVGDYVTLTHPSLPNYETGGYGLSAVPMQVLATNQDASPTGRNLGSLDLIWQYRCPTREWAPCLKIDSLESGSEYNVEVDTDAGGFSLPDAVLRDIEHYQATWKVNAYIPGIDVLEAHTITAVDVANNRITLDSALVISPASDVVIEFDTFDTTGDLIDAQESFAFVCDSTDFDNTNASLELKAGARWY